MPLESTAIVVPEQGPQGKQGAAGATGAAGAAGTNGKSYGGSSATSLAIGLGSKIFTTQSNLAWQAGSPIRAMSQASFGSYMEGFVLSYGGNTLVMQVIRTGGSGSFNDWNFSVVGDRGAPAGGSVSIGLQFDNSTTDADPGGPGKVRINNATQSSGTKLYVDLADIYGIDRTGTLDSLDDSSSTVKGLFRLSKDLNPDTIYIEGEVTAVTTATGYRKLDITIRAASSANPFAAGDALIFSFMRTGDAASPTDGSVTAVKLATSAMGPRAGMINGKLVQTRSANAETFAVKTLAGNDPSASDPVYFIFQDGAGGYVVRTVTAALSLVISSGSTLGASNGVPFRVWIVAADDAGTVRLAAVKTATASSIRELQEWTLYSSTAEGGAGAADSAQTLYSGTAFTNKFICLVGFGDWDSGLTTAGTWNAAPTRTITFGPGIPRPAEPIKTASGTVSAAGSANNSTSYTDTGLSVALVVSCAVNGVEVEAYGSQSSGGANSVGARIARGSTQIGNNGVVSGNTTSNNAMKGLDFPGAAGSTTYKVQDKTFNAASSSTFPNGDTGVMAVIKATELMA